MKVEPQSLVNLRSLHKERGTELFCSSSGKLFPCDGLAFGVLNRSMQLMKSFDLLLANDCYSSCAGILRMQLDNVLRFHGVLRAKDPHEVANSVLNGIAIRKIDDESGKKMTDARLVELVKPQIPWVSDVYDFACNYIHLSDQHVHQFSNRSEVGSDGLTEISIGDGDEHMSAEQEAHL
jgi:hypothetical protein